jgi:hypothetical protein
MNLRLDRLSSFYRANSLRTGAAVPVKHPSPQRLVGFLLVAWLMFVAFHSAQADNPQHFAAMLS